MLTSNLWGELWGEEFVIEPTDSRVNKLKSVTAKKPKVVSEKSVSANKNLSIEERLELIAAEVNRILGSYKTNTIVLDSSEKFKAYIDAAIQNGIISIDTETDNSLDPLTCKLMGLCLYTPGQMQAYIPINHTDLADNRLSWQVTEEQVKEQLDRLRPAKVKNIFQNGKFDYQVIKCTCKCKLQIYWDTMIGSRILNENEPAGLKEQYISKIDSSIEHYSIEHLFKGIKYAYVAPKIFALYAATDAYMTYKLYLYQVEQFNLPKNKIPNAFGRTLYDCFMQVEMPCVEIFAEMELTGVAVDFDYAAKLQQSYHAQYDALQKKLQDMLVQYSPQIDAWRATPEAQYHPWYYTDEEKSLSKFPEIPDLNRPVKYQKSKAEQLANPVVPDSLNSPTQLAILLFDVLGLPEGILDKESDKKKSGYVPSRGTGEDVLNALDSKVDVPLLKQILVNRNLNKLINTYIDNIPNSVNPSDKRIHTHFNQIGADTGRTSSSDPVNLQNIPSHNHQIRPMFVGKPGYTFVGSDFSGQEPRLLAHYSKDEAMGKAYKEGKDVYAVTASMIYDNAYEDNLEFKDGVYSEEGYLRRSSAKPIILGIMYGRGIASIAEVLKCSEDKAQEIMDTFFNGFPGVKTWINSVYEFVRANGYVEDYSGRRRRLNDILLPKFTLKLIGKALSSDFNPLLHCKGIVTKNSDPRIIKFTKDLENVKSKKELDAIIAEAKRCGVEVINNSGKISRAERQCVNAAIQGGAATLTKLAMIEIYNDEFMKERDAKLVINVHDELLMECPEKYAEECADRLAYDMCKAATDFGITIPMKCDAGVFRWWYQDKLVSDVKNECKDKDLIPEVVMKEDKWCFTPQMYFELKKEVEQALKVS